MKEGDRVVLNADIECHHMFPKKYTDPEQITLPSGSIGTVTSAYSSGGGIVQMDAGKKIFSLNLSGSFSPYTAIEV